MSYFEDALESGDEVQVNLGANGTHVGTVVSVEGASYGGVKVTVSFPKPIIDKDGNAHMAAEVDPWDIFPVDPPEVIERIQLAIDADIERDMKRHGE